MDETTPLSYHPLSMTVNGVTKSVLIPLPKSRDYGKPVTAKLPDGSSIVITPGVERRATVPVTCSGTVLGTVTTSSTATATRFTAGQHTPKTVSVLTTHRVPEKRAILRVNPVSSLVGLSNNYQLQQETHSSVIIPAPRLGASSSSYSMTTESPAAVHRVVGIAPALQKIAKTVSLIRLPVSVVRPTLSTGAANARPTRPIILRKSQPPVARSTVVVRPCIQSPAVSAVSRLTESSSSSGSDSSLSAASTLTVVSSPRTLSHREAVAAGWSSGSACINENGLEMSVDDVGLVDQVYPVRHIVPMNTDCNERSFNTSDHSQLHEDLKTCSEPNSGDSLLQCTETVSAADVQLDDNAAAYDDDRHINDNQTAPHMKVIEIYPDADEVACHDRDEENDVMPAALGVKVEGASTDNDASRQCSSTDTAMSDAELSTSFREDFVVLAEWTQEPQLSTTSMAANPPTDTAKRPKRRRCTRKKSKWRKYRGPSLVLGGRPMTVEERYSTMDCFVSLPVMRLPKPSVDVRHIWRYVCCREKLQRCKCLGATTQHQGLATADESKICKLVQTVRLAQPSMVTSDPTTLPVQLSGPTSADGLTPLVVRQPDGKLASVVAKRTFPGGSAPDASKKKYLLIKTKTGSYLMPVDSLGGTAPADLTTPSPGDVPATSPSPSPTSTDVKPTIVTDTSGHRQRIQQLKERLRQQEEQLQSIRSQRSCSAVQNIGWD